MPEATEPDDWTDHTIGETAQKTFDEIMEKVSRLDRQDMEDLAVLLEDWSGEVLEMDGDDGDHTAVTIPDLGDPVG